MRKKKETHELDEFLGFLWVNKKNSKVKGHYTHSETGTHFIFIKHNDNKRKWYKLGRR